MKPTQQMVDDFGEAWHARQMSGVPCQPGDKRRAGLAAALKDVPDVEPFAFDGYPDNPVYLHPSCGTVVDVAPIRIDMHDQAAYEKWLAECDCENTGPWLRIYVEREA